jgi:hypothetical protein
MFIETLRNTEPDSAFRVIPEATMLPGLKTAVMYGAQIVHLTPREFLVVECESERKKERSVLPSKIARMSRFIEKEHAISVFLPLLD